MPSACRALIAALLSLVMLSACVAPHPAPPGEPAPHATPALPALPDAGLSPSMFYKFMVAEIALQRGMPQVAAQAMLELARETQDARVAQRATEIAWNARLQKEALEAASLWLKADPQSAQARQVVAALLANQERLAEARVPLEQWLAADVPNVGRNFMQLGQRLAQHKDKKAVLELMRTLARPYAKVAEVRLALAQAAFNANDVNAALAESRAALDLRADFELAALFHVQALQRRSNAEALKFLEDYVNRHPKAHEARLNYARLLAGEKRPAQAREQFELLIQASPKNPDIAMAVGLMALQSNDLDAAEKYLKVALAAGHKAPDAIWLMLGQVHEERKNFDEALKWYAGVTSGERYISAQTRYAGVLAKQGKHDAAREHLRSVEPRNAAQRNQLAQAQANLLRETKAYSEAYDLLGKTLEGAPDAVDLLYDQAMIAEKLDRLDVLERNLRRVIEIQPDHAHAYNALGYTLADRNLRLPEARKLIEKAIELAPDDGYIIDSLGWVLFRMGRVREAIVQLRRAFDLRPEGEVGAHLGEALWVDGQRDEAAKVWNQVLKETPVNDVLISTLKRLAPHLLPAGK
ncbi:MAG: tetratricopeptide repeat protein [Betaproteobacteria bacterium]|nr:tetratricopeptide repeat protein [Betaproteobacteria bacterium]